MNAIADYLDYAILFAVAGGMLVAGLLLARRSLR
jgi:hypothetical protein